MNINWYPGHMKKTKDMIVENLKLVDLVVEILDARIPLSSKNPDIYKLTHNKKRIIVLNKTDLIDEKNLKEWKNYFIDNGLSDYFVALSVEKGSNFNQLKEIIKKVYNEKLEKMKKKGLRKTVVRMMIVGIPNVGKSKFINKISKKNKARVGNTPGFTRGKQWIKVDDTIELLDTPGVLWPKFEDETTAYNLAITGSIKDNVLPLEKVAFRFLEQLRLINKLELIYNSYKLDQHLSYDDFTKLNNYEIMAMLEKRLGITKKSEDDFIEVSKFVLKDYRSGKIGKFFLERVKF